MQGKKNAIILIIFRLIIPLGMILLLPLLCVFLSGKSILPYLAFPPKPMIVDHAPLSMFVFILISAFIVISVAPFLKTALSYTVKPTPRLTRGLPWWGYGAFTGLACFWVLAWCRFEWFSPWQAHTFFPLWFCWIICVNSLTYKDIGHCPLTDSPLRFAGLFIVSAAFWWVFEYLNRFVGNWYYSGSQYPAGTYFLLATLSFSTVLPAVESMKFYLLSFDLFENAFKQMPVIGNLYSKSSALFLIIFSSMSLILIGVYPDQFFFCVWISPLFMLLGFRILSGDSHILEKIKTGDNTMVVSYACAALACGFFWELFNMYSFARWQYSIPYVQVFHLFEMPILGYAGYLPFGLECALIIEMVMKGVHQSSEPNSN